MLGNPVLMGKDMKRVFFIILTAFIIIFSGCSNSIAGNEGQSDLTFNENIDSDMAVFASALASIQFEGLSGDVNSSDIADAAGLLPDDLYEEVAVIPEGYDAKSVQLAGKEYSAGSTFSLAIGSDGSYSDLVWKIDGTRMLINKVMLLMGDAFGYACYIDGQEFPYSVFSDNIPDCTIEVSFQEAVEGNTLSGTGSSYEVSVYDPSVPVIIKANDCELFLYEDGLSMGLASPDDGIYSGYEADAALISWPEYDLKRDYIAIDGEGNASGKFNLTISFTPNKVFYCDSIIERVQSSVNIEDAGIAIAAAFNNIDWGCVIPALAGDEQATEISALTFLNWMQDGSSISLSHLEEGTETDISFTELIKAYTDATLSSAGDGDFTMAIEIPQGYDGIFSDGSGVSIESSSTLEMIISGTCTLNITGVENVGIDLESYTISTREGTPFIVIIGDQRHEIQMKNLVGNLSGHMFLDAKSAGLLSINDIIGSMSITEMSLPDSAESITVDGIAVSTAGNP